MTLSKIPAERVALRRFVISSLVILLGFSLPLYHLISFALHSDLYSFIVIVPFISAYLIWIERSHLFPGGARLHPGVSVVLFCCSAAFLVWAVRLRDPAGEAPPVDSLALSVYALVLMLAAAAAFFLGRQTLRQVAFPLGFLFFLAPLPGVVETGFETLLQHGSSWTAHRFFDLSGMPVFREGTIFQLPGFSMQVAPECSGIRSTLALFLTSLVAGRLFLRSTWKKSTLAMVVLPIALVRNGFRVFVIGELCVQIGPHMIHSWIHRHGGPLFFALSLIPFSLILFLLYRSDRSATPRV